MVCLKHQKYRLTSNNREMLNAIDGFIVDNVIYSLNFQRQKYWLVQEVFPVVATEVKSIPTSSKFSSQRRQQDLNIDSNFA
jgi:hypothetical protein